MARWARFAALSVVVLMVVALLGSGSASAGREWQWAAPLPQGEDLYGIAYGGGQYVAVGAAGAMMTSGDGETWTVRHPWTRQDLMGIVFGPDRFVAVGTGGVVLTSVDGATWVRVDTGTDHALRSVAYGNGLLMAVGQAGAVLLSADGAVWKPVTVPFAGNLHGVIHDGTRFMVYGEGGTILSTADGGEWVTHSKEGPDLYALVTGGGRMVAMGSGGSVLLSTDGLHWNQQVRLGAHYSVLYYTAGRFVAVGERVATSPDGETWQMGKGGGMLSAVARGKGAWVAVGAGGATARSADGISWNGGDRAEFFPRDVAFGGGRFVVMSGDTIRSSTDGLTWVDRAATSGRLTLVRLIYGQDRFVAGTQEGAGLTSTDGIKWSEVEIGVPRLSDMAAAEGLLVAVGDGVAVSKDGLDWKAAAAPEPFTRVAYGDGVFVALGDSGYVYLSKDGLVWNKPAEPLKVPNATAVAFGNGAFVILTGWESVVLRSPDGVTWTKHTALSPKYSSISYDGVRFVALGKGGALATSSDGTHWHERLTGTWQQLYGIAMGNSRHVMVGSAGAILLKQGEFSAYQCGLRFADVPEEYPPCTAIELLELQRIIAGYPDGLFRPHRPVSRAEFAKLLVLSLDQKPEPAVPVAFPDAAGHWSATMGYLQPAVKLGALIGFPDGTLRPEGVLTRAQATKIVVAAAGYTLQGSGAEYTDVLKSEWYAPYVATARRMGLIGFGAGYDLWDGPTFHGEEPVTRAEAAMLLANVREAIR